MIPRRFNRNIIAAVHDAVMAGLSFLLAIYLRLGEEQWHEAADYIVTGTMLLTVICVVVFSAMRLYRGLWRYASLQDMLAIVKAVTLSILIFTLAMFMVNRLEGVPRSVFFINWMLLLCMLAGPRFTYRAIKDRAFNLILASSGPRKIPVLLIGAGDQAEQFIRDLGRNPNAPYEVIGLVDDDPNCKRRTLHRVQVYGTTERLSNVVNRLARKVKRPQKLIVTDERTGDKLRYLLDTAEKLGIPLALLRVSELKHGVSKQLEIRPISVEDLHERFVAQDLINRSQNMLDPESMRRFVEGKKVLVTGAGGTIGGELTRQIASFKPQELVLLDLCEYNIYQIERKIRAAHHDLKVETVLGDVRDVRHVDNVFNQYKPQLVFHAAAIKHVPIAEANIEEAILTNVFGTCNIAENCQKHQAQVMVMISTDKAVNPTNVMGATKRLAESFCQALGASQSGATKFITVRFGNVLDSSGSVVPLFREQIAEGGPVTVTHPEMMRYFMTVREAVELVLQAATLGVVMQDRRECIFVLDMGKQVKILDLAQDMIRLSGLKDIKIVFTGLRPGEKLHEELFYFAENAVKTIHEGIFLASPRFSDLALLRSSLEVLSAACAERKTSEALEWLKKLVPEFQTQSLTLAA